MIVCICFNVSDRVIRERAREGASLAEVLAETGAGSACGTCQLAIARIHAGQRDVTPPCARADAARDAA